MLKFWVFRFVPGTHNDLLSAVISIFAILMPIFGFIDNQILTSLHNGGFITGGGSGIVLHAFPSLNSLILVLNDQN